MTPERAAKRNNVFYLADYRGRTEAKKPSGLCLTILLDPELRAAYRYNALELAHDEAPQPTG